jgi:hypothetical protein
MKNAAYSLGTRFGFESISIEWERILGILAAFCGIAAIALGIVWIILRKDFLLFLVLGFSSSYFIGRNLLPSDKINSVES